MIEYPYKNAFHGSAKGGSGSKLALPGLTRGSSASGLLTFDQTASDLIATNSVLARLKSRNPMFESSYKTFSNFGNKMPESIKRLQNEYVKNNGGSSEHSKHKTDRVERTKGLVGSMANRS